MATKALCIGIKDYPRTDNDLSACVNDANDRAEEFSRRGFAVNQLLNEQPKRAAMIKAIGGFIEAPAKGDTLVITYSGYGTWVPDGRWGPQIDRCTVQAARAWNAGPHTLRCARYG